MSNSNNELIERLEAELELAEVKLEHLNGQLENLRQAHGRLNREASSQENDLLTVTHPATIHNQAKPEDLAIKIGQSRQGIAVLQDTIRSQEALSRLAETRVDDLRRDLAHHKTKQD